MLNQEPRIGDRFQQYGCIFEYIGNSRFCNLRSGSTFPQYGTPNQWSFQEIEFIGNFSKQDNFTQLYELFSQDI